MMIASTLVFACMLGTGTSAFALERAREGIHWGALPFANYTTDEGMKTGVLAQRFDYGVPGALPFRNLTTAQISYATLGEKALYLEHEVTGITALNLRSRTLLQGFSQDRARFYGLGPDSPYSVELERAGYYFYRRDLLSLKNTLRGKLANSDWEIETGIDNSFTFIKPNGEATLFAENFGTELDRLYTTKLLLGIVRERRDSEFIPTQGSYFSAFATYSPALLSNTSSWARADFDYRRYFPLIPHRWLTLAAQVRYSGCTESAPLTEKVRLGSAGTLRGLRLNRYLSNHSFSLRPELRSVWIRKGILGFPAKAGTGIFLDTGRISEIFPGLFRGENHVAWGVSLFGSYFTDDFLGHADFGFSREGTSLYVGLGHVF